MLRTVDDWKTCCAANPRERPRKGYFATFHTTGRVAGTKTKTLSNWPTRCRRSLRCRTRTHRETITSRL